MNLEIRLFATLRNGRSKVIHTVYPEDCTARDVIEVLGIDVKDVAILLVNGRDGQLDAPLKERDILSIFPPVGGG